MSDSIVVVEPVATIRSTILGVKWLRSALKLLTSVAPPSILGSKMARTFVACFGNETWLGAQAGAVKMLARVEHCHAPADGLHCFPIDRLSLIAKSIDPANDLRMTWDDGAVLTLESHQKNGLRSVFNLATPLAEGIKLPEACGVDCWSVPAQDFAVAIEAAKVAMGESSRYKTDGIRIEASGELVSVKATDGTQLAIRKLDARDSGPDGSVFLPSETVKSVLSVVKASSDYLVRFRIDTDPVERVHGGKTQIVDRLRFSLRTDNVILEIMAEPVAFPDLGSVLATNLEGSVDFREPARLVKAIETAHKTEEPDRDGNRIVTLASSCGSLVVRTGSGETLIGNVRISGKPFERHFSTAILLPYLKTVAKLDNLTLSVSFPEPGAKTQEPVRFSTYERGEHWVMPFGKPEPVASVEPEPEPVAVVEPEPVEPVKTIEPEPVPTLPELPEWVTHVRVNSCGRVTDYKRELRYPDTWTPSGNSHAYYMAMEGTDRLREYLRLGMLAIVTPEPVEPVESPEPVRTVCKAWRDVEPGARIRNPVSGETFTVLSIGKSWCGGVRITTKERDDIVGRHDQMLDVVVEPVAPPIVTRVAACNPEPVASDVKPLRPEPVKPKRVRKRKASPDPKPTDPPIVADDVTSDTPEASVDVVILPISGGSPEAPTLEDITADEIIGSTDYPNGEFDPDGSIRQAEMRAVESIIRWDIKGFVELWSEILLGHTEDDRLYIVERAGAAYDRMTRSEQRDFHAWCDWIGYQPGFIAYGRLADDERYQSFVEECLVGVPVTFAEPPASPTTGPGGSDEGSDEEAPDDAVRGTLGLSLPILASHPSGLPTDRPGPADIRPIQAPVGPSSPSCQGLSISPVCPYFPGQPFSPASLSPVSEPPLSPVASDISPAAPHPTIDIKGRAYALAVGPDGIELTSPEGESHYVIGGEAGHECSCPDSFYRGRKCKHLTRLEEAGLIPPPGVFRIRSDQSWAS